MFTLIVSIYFSIASTANLVAIKVTDANSHKAIKGAQVALDGAPPIASDSSGVASFINVAAGTHKVVVKANGKTTSKDIYVVEGSPDKVQQFDVAVSSASSAAAKPIFTALIALLLLVLLIGGGKGLGKKLKLKSDLSRHFPSTTVTSQSTAELPVKEATLANMNIPAKDNKTINKVIEPTDAGNVEKLINSSRSWNDQKAHNG